MNCIDLRQQFGSRYRIGHDPAAKHEPGGMNDPWLYTIPCKYGEVYPYGGECLAFHCKGTQMRGIIKRAFPDFKIQNWSDPKDGDAIFVFHVDRFPKLAKIIKPRVRRYLSESQRQRIAEMPRKDGHFIRLNETAFVKSEGTPAEASIETGKS